MYAASTCLTFKRNASSLQQEEFQDEKIYIYDASRVFPLRIFQAGSGAATGARALRSIPAYCSSPRAHSTTMNFSARERS